MREAQSRAGAAGLKPRLFVSFTELSRAIHPPLGASGSPPALLLPASLLHACPSLGTAEI